MLETIGFDAAVAASYAPWDAADASVGRVARVDRGVCTVLTEAGPERAGPGGALLAAIANDPVAAPCAGDWCVLRAWPDGRATVEHLLPRRSAVVRAAAGRRSHGQALCANADLVAVVVGLQPLPSLPRIERLLALAFQSGARPLVVLTKADLAADADEVAADVAALAPGVPVLVTSAVTGRGLADLRALLEDRLTVALVGASGHGKSRLTNALVGAEVLTTRPVRADGRGRHTTVRMELVLLPQGGAVVDVPGLRLVGLLGDGTGLESTFADLVALAARCRFDDCSHTVEPGCAVVAAVADGRVPLRRFESWQRLRGELARRNQRASERSRNDRSRSARLHRLHRPSRPTD